MLVINDIALNLVNSPEPVIKQIYALANKRLHAIGLRHGVVLDQQFSVGKAKLLVIQGEIDFNTSTQSYRLERFDSFDVPEHTDYQLVGVFDAIFLLFAAVDNESLQEHQFTSVTQQIKKQSDNG